LTEDPRDERDRLPVARYWEYEHDGQITDVTAGLGAAWPDVLVRIAPRGRGIQVEGEFTRDGRLRRLEFTATGDGEVVSADLRRPSIVRALKAWEVAAREAARQILAGVPPRETVIDARTPAEALRALMSGAGREPGTRRRGADAEELLRQVAAAYRETVAAGDPRPRETLAARFGYTNAHIGRLLTRARRPRNGQPPLLGPARPGKAGETSQP
jgi:hypothetical protein